MKIFDKVDDYYKRCNAYAGAIAAGLMFVAPFISQIANKIKQSENVKDSLEVVIRNIEDYKKEYSFDKYDKYISEFLNDCKNLQSIYLKIDNKNISLIKEFIELAYKIQMSSQSVKSYIDDLKGMGGKSFDMAKTFGLNFGFETLSTKTSDSIDTLYKQLSMEVPKLEQMYKDLSEKILNKSSDVSFEKTEFDDFADINF